MTDTDRLLDRIKKTILEKEPDAEIHLFGSRARGTAHAESDWDLLILLNKDKITPDLEKKITYPLYDIEFETGQIMSPLVLSKNDWETRHRITPFYENVQKEGIVL